MSKKSQKNAGREANAALEDYEPAVVAELTDVASIDVELTDAAFAVEGEVAVAVIAAAVVA